MKKKEFFAHTLDGALPEKWQPLEVHLKNVGEMAKRFAEPFGAGNWAYLAGLWHDLGKYSSAFQNRLLESLDADAHIERRSGRPDHSTAGAQHAFSKHGNPGKLIAYAIAGHHAGLPDGNNNEPSCLHKRLQKDIPDWSARPERLLAEKPPDGLPLALDGKRAGFQLSFFTRMLYSCLVDADFLDTESFMDPERASWRGHPSNLKDLEKDFSKKLARLIAEASQSPVNRQRKKILDDCIGAAFQKPGFVSLTVPTGGGKTLSSLAFALRHANANDLSRIIYAIPFTSIIEQNAAVFRKFLGEQSVLEHHSNYEPREEDHISRLASENWDAPLVVTTNVQFFESLFAHRSSRCRKLHNIANSVIILDEAQALPSDLLLACLEALRELVLSYGATVVLCSATQPALSRTSIFPGGLEGVREIMPDPKGLYAKFSRVEIRNLAKLDDETLAERLAGHERVLCIVNTRDHARVLYEKIGQLSGARHLSALMCPAHRSRVLASVREDLAFGHSVRLVSTQLVEAGVDLDFPVVYRSFAGLDSLAQAAGRCNREGRMPKPGQVFCFEPEKEPSGPFFKQAAQAAREAIRHHPDSLSQEAMERYFRFLYWSKGEALDKKNILTCLESGIGRGDFDFRKVARAFQIIENIMEPVIIGYGDEGHEVLEGLRRGNRPGYWARKAQLFTVSVYSYQMRILEKNRDVECLHEQFNVLANSSLYTEELGLVYDGAGFFNPETLIVDGV